MATTIDKSTLNFLAELAEHNAREWFAENKKRYDAARQNYIAFLDEMLPGMEKFEPVVRDQKGKDLVFRIYRDVRFSTDKRPYKDHFGAYIAEGGRKSIYPGYYLHLAGNDKSFLAGGLWYPPAEQLKAVRQEIDYSLDEFKQILEAPAFKKHFKGITGDQLKTTPKGYDKDNPAIEYLRYKGWNGVMNLPDKVVLQADFMDVVLTAFRAVKPLNDFLIHPMRDVEKEK
ncbi:DUF2461 domain-containing protein [Pontibacter arcticus]|uniref:DUF2461 domain-containing protein n=1 Tax=Pontibacter arcticus TaxID=2080288 RepID=A0A364RBV1_9BACT|nr:DUF2461 domain-containing protein [Pontibacter arcticus]RAU81735.1 DUF2461 domain-containing protein [Pontibacter arcticus]